MLNSDRGSTVWMIFSNSCRRCGDRISGLRSIDFSQLRVISTIALRARYIEHDLTIISCLNLRRLTVYTILTFFTILNGERACRLSICGDLVRSRPVAIVGAIWINNWRYPVITIPYCRHGVGTAVNVLNGDPGPAIWMISVTFDFLSSYCIRSTCFWLGNINNPDVLA